MYGIGKYEIFKRFVLFIKPPIAKFNLIFYAKSKIHENRIDGGKTRWSETEIMKFLNVFYYFSRPKQESLAENILHF